MSIHVRMLKNYGSNFVGNTCSFDDALAKELVATGVAALEPLKTEGVAPVSKDHHPTATADVMPHETAAALLEPEPKTTDALELASEELDKLPTPTDTK